MLSNMLRVRTTSMNWSSVQWRQFQLGKSNYSVYDPQLDWFANSKVTEMQLPPGVTTNDYHIALEEMTMVQALTVVSSLDAVLAKNVLKIVLVYVTEPISRFCFCYDCRYQHRKSCALANCTCRQ